MLLQEVKFLVVHCSDTPDGRDVTAAEIHEWHRAPKPRGNGWDGIGYHAVIRRDGTVENGRPGYWPGAHVRGLNHSSLGVCLIGTDEFTNDQLNTLEAWLRAKLSLYPEAKVAGHGDLDSSKTCPNFNVKDWWHERKQNWG